MSRGKYHLITYGCQMNKSDSERLASVLERLGLESTTDEKQADVILMNSCSVRQTAEDRIYGQVRNFNELRQNKPNLIIGVTGCMAGRDHDGKLRAKLPGVDLFFPTKDMVMLPRWISGLNPDLVDSVDLGQDYLKTIPKYEGNNRSYVTVQTGCNKFCTYCVVPYARGLEKNRPVADILAEIRALAERGTAEVMLLGQAVNAYKAPDRSSFSKDNPYQDDYAALLWEVNQVPGIERINWTGPHPVHMTDEVVDAIGLPKQVNFLHLPVQAGNNEVLKRMNRRYTREQYLEIIRKVRAVRPTIAIGTDIIVGFCGETAEQFEDTVSLYKEADFDISYPAMYSSRSGTIAQKFMKDDVSREEKKRRWNVLQTLMEETVMRKNQVYVGQQVEVLVDDWTKGMASGNSREMKRAQFPCFEDLRGRIVKVDVYKALEWILVGTLAAEPSLCVSVASKTCPKP